MCTVLSARKIAMNESMNNCMYCRRSCPRTALTYIHIRRHVGVPCGVQRLMNSSSTVTWLLDKVLIARQHTWQGAGGLRNHSIMSSAAVMNPTHATHKPHNNLQYCWSGFIHIWQFRLMVLFRFACRKTQQVIHTQVSHIPIRMHTSLLM